MPPRNVLIVEDEVFVAMDLESILVGAGYDVVAIAADRAEALRASDAASIAFVDLNLRDGATGASLARDLAERGIKVCYVTANPAQIGEPATTAVGYLHKPFDETAVRAAATLLSGGRPGDDAAKTVTLFRSGPVH